MLTSYRTTSIGSLHSLPPAWRVGESLFAWWTSLRILYRFTPSLACCFSYSQLVTLVVSANSPDRPSIVSPSRSCAADLCNVSAFWSPQKHVPEQLPRETRKGKRFTEGKFLNKFNRGSKGPFDMSLYLVGVTSKYESRRKHFLWVHP